MNMPYSGQSSGRSGGKLGAYGQAQKAQVVPTGNSRDTDARALAACARRLDDARMVLEKDPASRENLNLCAEAVRHNQRLWTIFQVALCDPQNPLPQDLKVILLNLSRYVDKTSFGAIGKYKPELLNSLIDINRIIAAGLTRQTEGAAAPVPAMDMTVTPTELMTSA